MKAAIKIACLAALVSVWTFQGVKSGRQLFAQWSQRIQHTLASEDKGVSNRVSNRTLSAKDTSVSARFEKSSRMLDFAPFDIVIALIDKPAIMRAKAGWFKGKVGNAYYSDEEFAQKVADPLQSLLPEKIGEAGIKCTVETKSIEGLTIRLKFQILEYDMSKLKSADFAYYLLALKEVLTNMDLADKVAKIEDKASRKVRAGLMEMLPGILHEKLQAEDVNVAMPYTDPPPETFIPTPLDVAPNTKLFFRVAINDRSQIAKLAGGGAKGFAVKNMPGSTLLNIVREKLAEKIPEALADELGGALAVSVIPEADNDAGSSLKKDSFGLRIEVSDIEFTKLMTAKKGEAFAHDFYRLMQVLKWFCENGVPDVSVDMENVKTTIWTLVMEGLETELPKKLREMLGAEVLVVSEKVYNDIRNYAERWRCCTTDTPALKFLVGKGALTGGGINIGDTNIMSRSGHCPPLRLADMGNVCVQKGQTQSHFAPIMQCLIASQMPLREGEVEGVFENVEARVEAECPKVSKVDAQMLKQQQAQHLQQQPAQTGSGGGFTTGPGGLE